MAESVFAREQREVTETRRAAGAFLLGLPAVVVAVCAIVCLTQGIKKQQGGEIRSHYVKVAQAAVDAEDWPVAEMLSRKAAALRPGDPASRYLVALCADGTGDVQRARRLMRQLAPLDRRGFAAAHWWLVRDLAERNTPMSVKQSHELRDHLRQFLATHDRHAEARMLLGQAELALGNWDWALEEMRLAAAINPDYYLTVGSVAARFGKHADSHSFVDRACEVFKLKVRESPDDVASRLQWVDGLTMKGDFSEAGEALRQGLDYEYDPRLCARLIQLSITTFDVLERQGAPTPNAFAQQLALMERSLSLAPDHRPLLDRLAQLSISPLDEEGRAAALLQPRLDEGTVPASVLMVLGNAALDRGDYITARRHLEAAAQLQPGYGVCLNNLAWALAHGEDAELGRALELIDEAIVLQPERDEFRETRGQILARLARYDEAVADLKFGLAFPESATQTHATLAEVYDALGQVEQAAYHRELE